MKISISRFIIFIEYFYTILYFNSAIKLNFYRLEIKTEIRNKKINDKTL